MNKILKIETKPPRFNDEFFGFNDIESYFLNLLKEKKLLNSYIFYGLEGLGKATFAYRLSRFLLNNETDIESCKNLHISTSTNIFKSISLLTHPDLKVIEPSPEKKIINKEMLNGLTDVVYSTSSNSLYKIIIIDSLDDFSNRNIYSSLLKLIEDCPKNCIFFLISSSLSNIPDTIKSRCQKIYFKPLNKKIMEKWFGNSNLLDDEKLSILINLSGGSLGKALKIINNDNYFKIYNKTKEILSNPNKLNSDDLNNLLLIYDKEIGLIDFFIIIQIIVLEIIKSSKNLNTNKINNFYIPLFFELNNNLQNYKFYNLDNSQILNLVKYIFIKYSKNIK